MRYKVLSTFPNIKTKRIFEFGEEITDNDLVADEGSARVASGFLERLDKTEEVVEEKIELPKADISEPIIQKPVEPLATVITQDPEPSKVEEDFDDPADDVDHDTTDVFPSGNQMKKQLRAAGKTIPTGTDKEGIKRMWLELQNS